MPFSSGIYSDPLASGSLSGGFLNPVKLKIEDSSYEEILERS
jgi:hypothetical protein